MTSVLLKTGQPATRPDLTKKHLITLLIIVMVGFVIAFAIGNNHMPGTPLMQSAAFLGTLCLLAPLLFFILKRSGKTQSPPT